MAKRRDVVDPTDPTRLHPGQRLKQHLTAVPDSNGADAARQRDELHRLEARLSGLSGTW